VKQVRLPTLFVHTGVRRDPRTGSIAVPVYQAATFQHAGLGESTGYDYSRTRNPTRDALEEGLALLEGGARGLAFSSGLAAIHCALLLFRPGDHLVVTADLYGGTFRLFDKVVPLASTFVDTSDLRLIEVAIRPETRGILVETPTNPLMKQADIAAIASLARERNLLLIVDSTFLTPYLLRPLELGADIVVHSLTKYLSGHNDVVGGGLIARDPAVGEQLAFYQNAVGSVLGPQDCYLVIRGIKTLALRMERHQQNARRVAAWLREHPLVTRVYYPGLGGMLSFEVTEAGLVGRLLRRLRLCLFAESLGGVETLITFPATQTHADMPEEVRRKLGISDTLLRLSVGIEDADDIIADLGQALEGREEP
jgi:cystathionine beta-lyase/cystathionine gamma-synthase